MEGCPKLLELMRGSSSNEKTEDKKLELNLRLAPPGEDKDESPFRCYSSMGSGWKSQQQLGAIFSSQWKSSPSVYQQSQVEKKGCSQPSSATVPANTAVNNTSQKRSAPAPVVGWPPVRSFRKNLASTSNSKQALDSQNGEQEQPKEEAKNTKKEIVTTRKTMFVKINMDGVPIGRKVDLNAYDSYEHLSTAVDKLFRGLLTAQSGPSVTGNMNTMDGVKEISGLLDGSGEYTLVYEDNEGDRMLVGDVPWEMFASTVKRLRVLKSSDLTALRVGGSRQGKTT